MGKNGTRNVKNLQGGSLKVALVYDRVNKIGGAERVLQVLHEMYPDAPLYTAVYNKETASWADDFDVRTTFLQNVPLAKTNHEYVAPLAPLAFESLDFSQFDLVISVTSEYAKGIITKPTTLHICYCLTPTRYLWSAYETYFRGWPPKLFAKPFVSYLRMWDTIAAQRPDHYIAISKTVQKRIKTYYGRESVVIYPPLTLGAEVALAGPAAHVSQDLVSIAREMNAPSSISASLARKSETRLGEPKAPLASPASDSLRQQTKRYTLNASDFFLLVSRLVPYKRIDVAIEAFSTLRLPLKIVGTGREYGRLKNMAGLTIEFVQNLTDEALSRYYQDCTALIFPGEEDFGLSILEAQAFGKPVIAFKSGGALETVIEGETGLFFYPQKAFALIKVLKAFEASKFDPKQCIHNAQRFSKEKFEKELTIFIEGRMKGLL